MDAIVSKIVLLFLLSLLRMPEVSTKNNKIKIIVPHKISVIHHHHSKITDLKPKKKLHFDVHDVLKSNQIHQQEEESEEEEEVSEERRFRHFLDEQEEESERGGAYYAIPATEYSAPLRVYMRPIFLYGESFDRRHPSRYEYRQNEDDLYYPEETYQGNMHLRRFQYKQL